MGKASCFCPFRHTDEAISERKVQAEGVSTCTHTPQRRTPITKVVLINARAIFRKRRQWVCSRR